MLACCQLNMRKLRRVMARVMVLGLLTEKKLSQSFLSLRSSSGSKESSSDRQMMSEVSNEMFSAKAKRQKP